MAITTANHHHLLLPTSIDMSTFSYSELHSLSLLSNSSLSLPSLSSTTTATTTSETTATSTASAAYHHRHRHHAASVAPEPDRSDSLSIVHFLKRYLDQNRTESVKAVEIVNRNGVVVDLSALEERDDPFSDEFARIVDGREKEEELLEILAGIDGNWCSKRKKRRIIDACLLGDALPVGWKVVIALRRKGGNFSPYCRRYISPTGEHLSSGKEVSSYLKSYFGINDTKLLRDSREDLHSRDLQQLQSVDLNNLRCLNSMDKTSMLDVSNATTSNTCLPIAAHEKDVSISNVENLPDVQVSNLYECHTCNISFDVKDKYMQHVLSAHERTTKRYRLGSSVGNKVTIRDGNYECHKCNISFEVKDKYLEHLLETHKRKPKKRRLSSSVIDGVIIRNGKYECQFCDKIFDERRRYIGHVGNHVKGSIKSTKGSLPQVSGAAESPRLDCLPAEIDSLKRDALIGIAQNTIQNEPLSVPENEPYCFSIIDKFCIARNDNVGNADVVPENSSFCDAELGIGKSGGVGKALSSQLNPYSKVSRVKNSYPEGTGMDNWKDKTLLKESLSPFKKDSEISVDIGGINGSLPCLMKNEIEKVSVEARVDFSTELLYSCDRMKGNTISNGTTNGPASCHNNIEVEKEGKEDKTSTKLKTCNQASVTFVAADGETKKQSFIQNNSTSNLVVKSVSTKDGGSPEEYDGLKVNFLSYNQKFSDMDSAAKNIQSTCMEHEPELSQSHNDGCLATVTHDARTFGCAALLNSSSPFDEIFEKAEQNICSLDSNLESGNGFEYMKLDEIEPQMYKYNALNEEDSIFLPEVSMDLENGTGFDLGFDASANSQSDFPEPIASTRTTMMTCVWCGSEFSHEVVEMDPQPDSVGFMCPDCRTNAALGDNSLSLTGAIFIYEDYVARIWNAKDFSTRALDYSTRLDDLSSSLKYLQS
ncbi:hypothetical protein KSS87_008018, partial [Heliosperma pusillum]